MRNRRGEALRKTERNFRWGVPLLWTLLALLLLGGIVGASYYYKEPVEIWEGLLPIPEGEECLVLIRPGINARQIAQAFADQGALDGSPARLAYWMTRFGVDRRFKPGRYSVTRAGPWDLARQLRDSRPDMLKLTIVPGMDVFSLRDLFSEDVNPVLPEGGDALRSAVLDDGNYPEGMRPKLPAAEESRIAFLLPETYLLIDLTPRELVQAASASWWRQFGPLAEGLSSQDVVRAGIIASMIQREALWDAECGTIAGVVQNRLNKGMPLQIDATVVYAWKLNGRRLTRVLNSDLAIDSPYNTYRVPGLPPHPICIPDVPAWGAAFKPEKNAYYYYVARKDGHHYFSESYSEHLRNIKKARSDS